MRCPACRHDNFEGEDTCEHCGADLRTSDIPRASGERGALFATVVAAISAGDPARIEPGAPVGRAIRRMHEEGIDCLLVCEGDRLAGIFTDRDAMLRAAGGPLAAASVRDLMTTDPVVLRAEDSVAVAIHKMAVGGFRHIPIVDGDRPIGVVAARDVFRYLVGQLG